MKNLVLGFAAAIVVASAGSASAATINVLQNAGQTYTTDAITGFATSGGEMNGMTVRATVAKADGTGSPVTYSGVWAGSGSTGGVQWLESCVGFLCSSHFDDFGLEVSGDTYDNNNWTLDFALDDVWFGGTSWVLQSMSFDGTTGNTVFDRLFGGVEGTAGSSLGKDFSGFSGYGGTINATYKGSGPPDERCSGGRPLRTVRTRLRAVALGGQRLQLHPRHRQRHDGVGAGQPHPAGCPGAHDAVPARCEPRWRGDPASPPQGVGTGLTTRPVTKKGASIEALALVVSVVLNASAHRRDEHDGRLPAYDRRRRRVAPPISAAPRSTRVAGSGTSPAVGGLSA